MINISKLKFRNCISYFLKKLCRTERVHIHRYVGLIGDFANLYSEIFSISSNAILVPAGGEFYCHAKDSRGSGGRGSGGKCRIIVLKWNSNLEYNEIFTATRRIRAGAGDLCPRR